jgi:D-sedoheptulose 7-phosphate isomerase
MDQIREKFLKSIEVTSSWIDSPNFLDFLEFSETVLKCLQNKGKIIIFGNGGSASEASHIAGEFVGKCVQDNGAFPALCLNDSPAAITAIANDWNFEHVFARQIQAHANARDVVIGLSTSGASMNVLNGLSEAKKKDCVTSLWTSEKFQGLLAGYLKPDYLFIAPVKDTPRAQELHLKMGHALAEYIEAHEI